MRVWLDDVRPMPEGYDVHVKTAREAIDLLRTGKVAHISLDHDLGESDETGYTVACFIEKGAVKGTVPRCTWNVHSANPVGRDRIKVAMISANGWWFYRGE